MSLGSLTDAQLIYRRRKTGYGPIPKGWRKLGAGAYRTSYLSPSRVVYKICHEDEGDEWNRYEFSAFKRYRTSKTRMPVGWRVAKTNLFELPEAIIAMEYIEGIHPDVDDDEYDEYFSRIGAYKAFELINLYDVHEGNFVITPMGKKVIIDLGE